ncbi:hypothetical protein RRG08_008501 [Elysia crispata]|uniref:Uncharacterized protein n=1 Tax=Elysia crispata TaxID=231223 RepID=A0AAE1DBJ8_9GAST|nr:hypothetical protein RRG08_008501 [Elysia crispata]
MTAPPPIPHPPIAATLSGFHSPASHDRPSPHPPIAATVSGFDPPASPDRPGPPSPPRCHDHTVLSGLFSRLSPSSPSPAIVFTVLAGSALVLLHTSSTPMSRDPEPGVGLSIS